MRSSKTDGRRERGARSREAIVHRAAQLASLDGFGVLTIGRLATDLGMSKAGVHALFGSKEALHLATIDAAFEVFKREVVDEALDREPGMQRVEALCFGWLSYARRRIFPGGCFFHVASIEHDAKPGPVRDRLSAARRAWLQLYEKELETAKRLGQLRSHVEPRQLARHLDAVGMAADLDALLLDDPRAFDDAEATLREVLRQARQSGSEAW